MNTKIIKFDINKRLYDSLLAKQGDTKSRFLLFNLFDGSIPFSLENRNVRVYAIKPDKTEVFNDLIITDAAKGYCVLELTTQMLAVAGTVKLELMVTEGEKKLTSNIFYMDVKESINSEKALVSTNEFGALLTALQEVKNWNKEFTEKSGKLEELYTPKLNKLSEQMDNNVRDINTLGYADSVLDNFKRWNGIYINVKDFGAKGDGITDDTNAIRKAISSLEYKNNAKDSRYYTLLFPYGWYKITDTIVIDKYFHVECLGNIVYSGATDRPAFSIRNTCYCNYSFNIIVDYSTYNHANNINDSNKNIMFYYSGCLWDNDNFKGLELINNKFCNFSAECIKGFTIAVDCIAEANGWWFNNTRFKHLGFFKVGLQLTSRNIEGNENEGWLNANYFYDTSFSTKPRKVNEQVWDIKQNLEGGNTYGANSNYFFNLKFETHGTFLSKYVHLELLLVNEFVFDNCRVELLSKDSIGYKIHGCYNGVRSCYNIHFNNTPLSSAFGGVQVLYNDSYGTEGGENFSAYLYDTILENETVKFKKIYEVKNIMENSYIINNRLYNSQLQFVYGKNVAYGCEGGTLTSKGVNIPFGYPIKLELTNFKLGDKIKFNHYYYKNGSTYNLRVVFLDENDTPLAKPKLIGLNRKYGQDYEYANIFSYNHFYISDKSIKKVILYISGEINDFELESNNEDIVIKKYFGVKETKLYTRGKIIVDAIPKTTDNILLETTVYLANEDCYVLKNQDNVKTWVKS